MVEVSFTDELGEWFDLLSEDEQADVLDVVRKLEVKGLALGFPHCSAVQGTAEPLRELRPATGAEPAPSHLRIRPTEGRGADHRRRQVG